MNKDRRAQLKAAIEQLQQAQSIIENAKTIIEQAGEDEQECFDNLTEGL